VVARQVADQVRGARNDGVADPVHAETLPADRDTLPVTPSGYDATEMPDKLPPGPNPWLPPCRESLIDRQLREAAEAGAFDDLPFRGEPLPLDDDSAAGDWALAHRVLRNANMAPPWIETDKEIRTLLAQRDAVIARAPRSSPLQRPRDRAELTRLVGAVNAAIFRLNHEAPTARQHRRRLDLEQELSALAAAHERG
jgi:hypothetical protein